MQEEEDGVFEEEVTSTGDDWDLLIGSASEHAAIRIRRYAIAEPENNWDANALDCVVDVRGGAFRGRFAVTFWTQDFVRLREGIERLDRDLEGEAAFETIEEQIHVRLTCNRLGHVAIAVKAMDVAGLGNRLTVSFESDQTMFAGVLAQLESIVRRFPVWRGSPPT